MTKPTASEDVLGISEIFEAILLNLDLEDLLRLQRVSRYWRTCISQTTSLQKRLFFLPEIDMDEKPRLNHLLQRLFPPFFVLTERPNRFAVPRPDDIRNLDWYQDEAWRGAVLRSDASWRSMYPVQPPARVEKVILDGWCCTGRFIIELAKINPELQESQAPGALMGLIYDVVINLLDTEYCTSFFVQWHMVDRAPDLEDINFFVEEETGFEPAGLKHKIIIYTAYYKRCQALCPPEATGLQVVKRNVALLADCMFKRV